MRKQFIPYNGYYHNDQLREAFVDWLPELDPDLSLVLNFNRPISILGARNKFKNWLARVDRLFLGHEWHKNPSRERTSGVAIIENPRKNLHAHVLLKFPPRAAALSRSERLDRLYDPWKKLEPQAQFYSEPIWDVHGAAKYNCKQLIRRGHLENCLILFNEFHHFR
jgi:hypothetical protein